MPTRALEFITAPRTRLVLTWLVLLATLIGRGVQGWINFRVPDRPDRNDGHTSIDFGGQWLMGRLLVLGHGQELYKRERHLEVAKASYPRDREPVNAADHDAERLISWYMGKPDDRIGGPLYPPVHAFVMAPFALIADPYWSYRVTQLFLIGCALVAAVGVRYWSRGRWWWSAAAAFLLLFPGCRGGIDLAQNSPFTVMLLIWGWALMQRGRPCWGGILWGLLAFKPVWAMSFLAALLLLRQWRSAVAMSATGAGLSLLTLPFVGLHSWFDWLHIAKLGSEHYLIDRNWIFLSRDLFGIPRRMLLEFHDGLAVADRPLAGYLGWALWSLVAAATLAVMLAARKRRPPDHLVAGFVFLACFLCAFRFMYYDAFVAALGVVALMIVPQPYFRNAWWPFASWLSIFVGLLLFVENVSGPVNLQFTGNIGGLKRTITAGDGATSITAPTFHVATGDQYPWDTLIVLAIWVWCALRLLRHNVVTGSDRGALPTPGRSPPPA